MRPVIFFDINGTLIERDSRTDLPFSIAVDNLLGRENCMEGVNTAARSDHDVFMEVLKRQHISYTDDLWTKFMELYLVKLENFKSTDVWRANVDCKEYLDYLSTRDVDLGLITGELHIGAEFKLRKIGVWEYFKAGGYGEDGLMRFDIAKAAVKKMTELLGYSPDDIWIIGDTILDIETARHIGAKVISITTGANTKGELASYSPDYVIDKFSDIKSLF